MKKNNQKSVLVALAFALFYMATVYLLSGKSTLPKTLGLFMIVLNAALFIAYVVMYIRAIGDLDEVQVKIQLEAVVIAFSLALTTILILALLSLIIVLPFGGYGFLLLLPLFFFYYFIGLFVSNRKYA